MNLKKLSEPFAPDDIEWRIQQVGKKKNGDVYAKVLAYITSRAIHDRFDAVCGLDWQMRYVEHLGGTVCEIGIKHDGEWIWRAGGSDKTQVEAFKGGLSGSEKRAGVPWGVGRYLYKLKNNFAEITTDRQYGNEWHWVGENKQKGTPQFWWKAPKLPDWALPVAQKPEVKPGTNHWNNAITAYLRDGNLDAVEEKATISDKNKELLIKEAKGEN